jgi:hypothetical protein
MSVSVIAGAASRIREALPSIATYEEQTADRIEGTGSAVIEVRYGGTWGPVPNNARHSVVHINVLADRTRDTDGLPTKDDADGRAWVLWETVDALFNDWGKGWAQVHSSRRAAGPALTLIPDGDGSVMLSARYEVSHD